VIVPDWCFVFRALLIHQAEHSAALNALLIVEDYLQAVKTELQQLQEQSQDEDMSQQLEMAELKAAAAAAEADASFERERRVRRCHLRLNFAPRLAVHRPHVESF
jgi:hypothetical protein